MTSELVWVFCGQGQADIFPRRVFWARGEKAEVRSTFSPTGRKQKCGFPAALETRWLPHLSSEFTSILPWLEPDSGIHPPQAQEAHITMGRRKKKKK